MLAARQDCKRQAKEGALAEKSTSLILEALTRAMADPVGLPLFATKTGTGLFVANAPAKLAAQQCKDDGLLHVVRSETKGKAVQEICTITEKGLAFVLEQVNPRQVLEQLVQAIAAREAEVGELVNVARETQASFNAFRATAEKVLQHMHQPSSACSPNGSGNGSEVWVASILSFLAQRQSSGVIEDCPLPELYRQAQATAPKLSIGHFHDGLRKLHSQELIYLHPWTGPLYEIPDPPLALLVGHEIAYYASRR